MLSGCSASSSASITILNRTKEFILSGCSAVSSGVVSTFNRAAGFVLGSAGVSSAIIDKLNIIKSIIANSDAVSGGELSFKVERPIVLSGCNSILSALLEIDISSFKGSELLEADSNITTFIEGDS